MKDGTRYWLPMGACLLALALQAAVPQGVRARLASPAAQPPSVVLSGETPALVRRGQARFLGAHAPSALIAVNLGLALRNQAALDAFIAREVRHGITMTREQFNARFAPPAAQVVAVRQWAAAHGLRVVRVSGNRALITLRGPTGHVASALHIAINDYRAPDGRVFFANDRDPSVPAALGVMAISGLDSLHRFRTAIRAGGRMRASPPYGYTPANFRAAYDVTGDGTGQTLGFILWGNPLPDSDLAGFANATGDVPMSQGPGPDQVQWIQTDATGSYGSDALDELALDVETAHGIATHAHLKYWLAPETCDTTGCGGTDVGLEDAISDAADDPSVHVVSNSWLDASEADPNDPFVQITTSTFEQAVAVGTTFYFATGDAGSDSGGAGLPSYPADSPYVVAVGGTSLYLSGSQYGSERAWSGSGGGCSSVEDRPAWQIGVTAATCSGRAIPDISADADPATGAFVFFDGSSAVYGGTSLATPLVAGMAAVADRYATSGGYARLGWAAPLLYQLATTPATYAAAYHDVTTGNNGADAAQVGWDEATGWGSLNWLPWVQAAIQMQVVVTTQIAAGWNLIGVPVTPASPLHASQVLSALLDSTDGHLAALYALTSGGWSPSLVDRRTSADVLTGQDFTLGVAQGYLLYSDTAGSVAMVGSQPDSGAAWQLSAGWNLVSPPHGAALTASALVQSVAATGANLVALYALTNGQWGPPVMAGARAGGMSDQDFPLVEGHAYLLYTNVAGTVTPAAWAVRSVRAR